MQPAAKRRHCSSHKSPSDSVYIRTTVGYRPSTLFSVRVFLVTCMCAQTNLTERERHRERTCYYDGGGIVLYERYPVPAPWCFHGVRHWGGPSKIDRLALSFSHSLSLAKLRVTAL